ncbi:hypothetical protein JK635_02405 [Neobacillus sp. YIM B02564]|uniref:Catalase immune-responsive domain-containing protein n=1 Tax=Neobacillus paridis TaxID=2803862 RepID=A0ABS1TIJ4_9BACI|nr:hypothetical protein [Neobacillus paridis]MBL4951092.1 hypothetical protein [Neobacillus paridis]
MEEQSERVQDLKIMLKVLGDLNNRYKQALEFYADDNNYKRIKTIATNIDMDNGKKAREVLGDKQ